jgi:putative ABC transport system ATP-binding protein
MRKLDSGDYGGRARSSHCTQGGIEMKEIMLDVKNVSKQFRGANGVVSAIDDISLQAKAGEFLAVQGASGSGKTTLLLAAGGLEAPDKGEIKVDKLNPYQMAADARAKFRAANIGFVFQQFHLIPYLSVKENVMAPSLALKNAEAQRRAQELIEWFKLQDRSGHKPSELSVGERQRVAMARALLNTPKLLLADEPTGNLDQENADIILSYLTEFAKSGGSVLMVTHSEQAAHYADREIHLKNGKLVNGNS